MKSSDNVSPSYLFHCYGIGFLKYTDNKVFPSYRCLGVRKFSSTTVVKEYNIEGEKQEKNSNVLDSSDIKHYTDTSIPSDANATLRSRYDICLGFLSFASHELKMPRCRGTHITILTEEKDEHDGIRDLNNKTHVVNYHEAVFEPNGLPRDADELLEKVDYEQGIKLSDVLGMKHIFTPRHIHYALQQVLMRSWILMSSIARPVFHHVLCEPLSISHSLNHRLIEIQKRCFEMGSRAMIVSQRILGDIKYKKK